MGILDRAELLLQAKNYSGSGDWLDESGNGHDAQFGSTAGADTNDPEVLAHDGEDSVRLPAVAGNFVSTDDVNLLDADTAHVHQSIGEWSAYVSAFMLQLDTDLTPVIGTNHFSWQRGGVTNTTAIRLGTGTGAVPCDASTEYTALVSASSETADATGEIKIAWYNAGGSLLSTTTAGTLVNLTGAWQTVSRTATSPATAAFAEIQVIHRSVIGFVAGEKQSLDAACLRTGATVTFVPSLRIVGDLDLRARLAADNYASGTNQNIVEVLDTVNSGGYRLRLDDNLTEMALLTGTGSGLRVTNSSGAALVDGTTYELQATFDVTSGEIKFYKDGIAFQTTSAATGAIGVGVLPTLDIGQDSGGGSRFAGNIYWAEVRDGIDGPVVARYSAEDAVEPFATQTGAVDGRVWTYNRSGSGLYVVDQPAFGLHTDDYFEVADHADLDFAAADSFTLMVLARVGVDTGTAALAMKGTGGTYWALYVHANDYISARINDSTGNGIDETNSQIPAIRTGFAASMVRDVAADTVERFIDGISSGLPGTDPTTLTLATADPVTIGAGGFGFFDGEIMAVALFREALTDDEIVQAGEALLGGNLPTLMMMGVG